MQKGCVIQRILLKNILELNNDDLFCIVACFLMLLLSIFLVFVFDDIVLNKHFTKKLHRRLGVESDD
jgi:hypothetical protein